MDQYYHHHQPHSQSWHTNPNYGYDYATAGGGDIDRSYKRPRIEEGCSGPARILTEDERRLKLIRDHGAASFSGFNQENKSLHNNINNNHNVNLMPPRSSEIRFSIQIQCPRRSTIGKVMNRDWEVICHTLVAITCVSSSVTAHSTYPVVTEPYYQNKPPPHAFHREDPQVIHRTSSVKYAAIPPKELSSDKAKFVDASELFKMPHRASRPDHIVIILRGLPGSGKSYLAKMLRDLEVENGGDAPRIHSMDDYFMTEVEKDEEIEVSKSSSSVRSKKTVKKMVMEYCYEPEMEEAYRESMLKAFKRTLEDGIFSFVIVDDRNLRVADFAQFWAIGKRSGYEVYVLEATYKDPVGCAARNVHGFTLDDIQQMAGQWEEAPSLYLQLDIKSLFHGDDLKESGIQEVDMDMEDGDREEGLSGQEEQKTEKVNLPTLGDHVPEDSSKDEKRWDAEGDYLVEVKELSRSKWSNNLDEDETEGSEAIKGNLNALSGLIQAYGNKGKSVRWSDQGGDTGFLIGAAKKAKMLSLVIGPGAGYNLKSNPLPKEESHASDSIGNSKKQSSFQERLRAEHESFKAVFDRKKRIGGLDLDEDQ
ncbi:hypothetical protein GOBAR_DD29400 [Gossypium barbadense]|nr:hypothetical protein GOBAR_DD29400 [Gossypium barbadense]